MNDKSHNNLDEDFPYSKEFPVAPKREIEKKLEAKEEGGQPMPEKKHRIEAGYAKPAPFKAKAHKPIPQVQDETVLKIEKILERDLGDQYARLSPIAKQEFKIKGEETAIKIKELLQSTHVKVKKILLLIIEWLKMLPGINKFFLEQEAKIKTDQLIELHKIAQNKHSDKLL
jgi:hypothetical protein